MYDAVSEYDELNTVPITFEAVMYDAVEANVAVPNKEPVNPNVDDIDPVISTTES